MCIVDFDAIKQFYAIDGSPKHILQLKKKKKIPRRKNKNKKEVTM